MKNGFFDQRKNLIYSYDRKKIVKKVDKSDVENYMTKYRYNPRKEGCEEIDGREDQTVLKILELKNK